MPVCSKQFDLTIAIENSARIGEEQFEQVKDFSKQFINAFDIREGGTHVAIVSYGTTPVVHTRLDSYSGSVLNKRTITDEIDKIALESGNAVITNTALTEVFKTVYGDGNGARNGTNKVICSGVCVLRERWKGCDSYLTYFLVPNSCHEYDSLKIIMNKRQRNK